MSKSARNTVLARSAARLACVQALYQMEISGGDVNDVVVEFTAYRFEEEEKNSQYTDVKYFSILTHGVIASQVKIDNIIESALATGWTLARLDSTLRALLRSAAFELLDRPDIPARVVINEYVDIAHAFFDAVEPAFVNGVLDRLAHETRADEFRAQQESDDDVSAPQS